MAFIRYRTHPNGATYASLVENYRVPGKRTPQQRTLKSLGRVGGSSSPGVLVPALPFMIAFDLITGSRVKEMVAARAAAQARPSGKVPTHIH